MGFCGYRAIKRYRCDICGIMYETPIGDIEEEETTIYRSNDLVLKEIVGREDTIGEVAICQDCLDYLKRFTKDRREYTSNYIFTNN